MQTQLSDDDLNQRKAWEEHAPNAFRQPDAEVLSMIAEIQERRKAEDLNDGIRGYEGTPGKQVFDHLPEGSH